MRYLTTLRSRVDQGCTTLQPQGCMRNHPFPSAHPALLQILETCIKNCVPQLYDALAHSELWFELVKMAADTSIARVRYNGLGETLGSACSQEWVAEKARPCTLP